MNFLTCIATLSALVSCTSAFAPVAPPAVNVAAPAMADVVTSTSNLPSQSELLQKASSSTLNVAAASTIPTTSTSVIIISDIKFDGKVPTTESDEYVVITNGSKNPVDISNYYVYVATSGTQGATFTFPKNSVIKAGQSIRIYTNELHPETGGYSFGSGKAIWNNRGGLAVLKDFKGSKLAEFKYKGSA